MLVEEWAGSTPIFFSPRGRQAPSTTLMPTTRKSEKVMAAVSGIGVLREEGGGGGRGC
jgi:hypothetical protein